VEKAFPEAVTPAVVLLGAAILIGMILEGTTALTGVIPIETIFEMTVGGIVLEEWLSVPH